jgi:hypothetical protein
MQKIQEKSFRFSVRAYLENACSAHGFTEALMHSSITVSEEYIDKDPKVAGRENYFEEETIEWIQIT